MQPQQPRRLPAKRVELQYKAVWTLCSTAVGSLQSAVFRLRWHFGSLINALILLLLLLSSWPCLSLLSSSLSATSSSSTSSALGPGLSQAVKSSTRDVSRSGRAKLDFLIGLQFSSSAASSPVIVVVVGSYCCCCCCWRHSVMTITKHS